MSGASVSGEEKRVRFKIKHSFYQKVLYTHIQLLFLSLFRVNFFFDITIVSVLSLIPLLFAILVRLSSISIFLLTTSQSV